MARTLQARPRRAAAALLGVALALVALAASVRGAPGVPAAPPILVSPPGGAYRGPDVALDTAGRALLVWQGEDRAAPGSDIYARLYGPQGHPLGAPFRVNDGPAGEQRRPAVAALPGVGFVVAWDTGSSSVSARLLGPDGAPLGGDIAVNTAGPGNHRDPDVAAAAEGFVVAWEIGALPGGEDAVALRHFSAAGAPLGGESFAAPAPGAFQLNPALAAGPDGALTLVWEELDKLTYHSALRLRRFDAGGAPAGDPLIIAEADAEELRDPVVSADAGGLLVAWAARDGEDATRIVSRRLNGDALAPAADAILSDAMAGERLGPALAEAADGSALAAWAVADSVEARLLDSAGAPEGEPFALRPPAADQHTMLNVAAAASPAEGPLWIVWCETTTSPYSSEIESAIYAQVYVEQLHQIALPLLAR
jgi:hypothetical protein